MNQSRKWAILAALMWRAARCFSNRLLMIEGIGAQIWNIASFNLSIEQTNTEIRSDRTVV
jgi:hypothetical protein